MSKILFLCNTYMQLIAAIQIKRKLFSDASADLIISDHSVNAEKVSKRLSHLHVFERVKVVNTKYYMYKQSSFQDFLDVVSVSFGIGNKYKKLLFVENNLYDRIFYYNFDFTLYTAFDICKRNGKNPVLCRYEEGIHSYQNMLMMESDVNSQRLKMINKIRELLHKDCVFGSTNDFYVFFEKLFPETDRKVTGIPRLSRNDKEMINILNTCFDYHPEKYTYAEKYIFFGSSREVDGFETEETNIVLQLAEKVGKDNLLVKMHPRDERNVYEEYGIKVSQKSSVPWEVIQMNHDFSKHVFVTMSSGSIICSCALLGDDVPSYLLYPIDRGKDKVFDDFCSKSLGGLISKLQLQNLCMRHQIVEGVEEISE